MKRLFLPIGIPILLVALGFAQTPAPSSGTDQISIKGCLSGSDGNYTVAEDNTGRILKLTGSSVDLKTHLGHDVKLVGHKVNGAGNSEAAGNNLAVTELTMISEHCAPTAAVPAATVSTTSDTVGTSPGTAAAATAAPAAAASVPSETTPTPPAGAPPNATASTDPAQAAAPTPAETVTPPEIAPTLPSAAPPNVSAPSEAVAAPAQAAPAPIPVETAVAPPAAPAVVPTRPSARSRKLAATTPAAVAPAEAISKPAATAAAPDTTATTPAPPVSQPLAKTATSVWSGSAGILVSFIVLVLLIGALTPLFSRWRKRKLLEQTSAQNLSFSHRASSDPGNGDKPEVRKAA